MIDNGHRFVSPRERRTIKEDPMTMQLGAAPSPAAETQNSTVNGLMKEVLEKLEHLTDDEWSGGKVMCQSQSQPDCLDKVQKRHVGHQGFAPCCTLTLYNRLNKHLFPCDQSRTPFLCDHWNRTPFLRDHSCPSLEHQLKFLHRWLTSVMARVPLLSVLSPRATFCSAWMPAGWGGTLPLACPKGLYCYWMSWKYSCRGVYRKKALNCFEVFHLCVQHP